jgi:hypothetical protein
LDRRQLALLCLAVEQLCSDPETEAVTVAALAPVSCWLEAAFLRAWEVPC